MRKLLRSAQCLGWVVMTYVGIICFQCLLQILLNPSILVGMLENNAPPTPVVETFSLPVNTEADVLTTQVYDGRVTITIWGEGQIDADTRHDAFRSYDSDGSVEGFYGFWVDDEGLIASIFPSSPTRSNPQISEYMFSYYVGDPPRQIAFRMTNGNP